MTAQVDDLLVSLPALQCELYRPHVAMAEVPVKMSDDGLQISQLPFGAVLHALR